MHGKNRWNTVILTKFLHFGWPCASPLYPSQTDLAAQTHSVCLHTNFNLNPFIVSPSEDENPQFWANFDIWEAVVPSPLTDESQIWCDRENPRSMLTCQISSWFVYSMSSGSKNLKFCHFFGLQHFVVSPCWGTSESWSLVHNYKPSSIQWYQNQFCTLRPSWWNCPYNWRFKAWWTNKWTDKNLTFLAVIREPPNLARW